MWTRVGARHFEVENDGVEHFGGTATLRKLTQGGDMRWWYTYRDVRMRVKGGATAQVNEE